MKKEYKKPSIKVEQYGTNVSVATSWCQSVSTLTCLVGGQTHSIFSTGQDGCSTSDLTYVYISGVNGIDDGYYYIWYSDNRDNFDGTDNAYTLYLKSQNYASGYHIASAIYGSSFTGSA